MIEIKNAVIESVSLSSDDRGFLDCWIHLDYGGIGQGFGGFVLYLPKSYSHHSLMSSAGHFLFRVMEVAGVTNWKDLKGKTVRVKCDHSKVYALGHIVKDDWFNPANDFEEHKQCRDINADFKQLLNAARFLELGNLDEVTAQNDLLYNQHQVARKYVKDLVKKRADLIED